MSKQLDRNLAHLLWSLWTEIGVAGLERKHRSFSIAPEELILLTSVLSEFDPRLRDEALDWCVSYHRYISPSRLQIFAKKYSNYLASPFSIFSATLNSVANIQTKWFLFEKAAPLKYRPSGKSILRDFKAPSMIHFRIRSLFGVGARSDIMAFVLMEDRKEFSASDLQETGYSKRRIAEILQDLAASGIFTQSKVRNQLRYTFTNRNLFIKLLGGLPKQMIQWHRILTVLLPIRACIQAVEDTPVGVRAIDMRNLLEKLLDQLLQIKLTPPPLNSDLEAYWKTVMNWVLEFTASLANGKN